MTHAKTSAPNGPQRQGGFAAIAAIFLVVVLAALGGYMVTFSNAQQLTATQDLLGSRAYWAANAGLEWAIRQAKVSTQKKEPMLCATPAGSPLTIDIFSVVVTCKEVDYPEGTKPDGTTAFIKIVEFESTAKSAGAVGTLSYIERSVSAAMQCIPLVDCPPS